MLDSGFNLFKIKKDEKDSVTVNETEATYFKAPVGHEGETSYEINTRVIIVSPSFNLGNKWRVSDGGRTLYVAIKDKEFERSVQQGAEVFRKGDILRVTLQNTQWLESGRLRTEYAISKVHRHEQGPKQQKLP